MAKIFCVENLDFVVIVHFYRQYATQHSAVGFVESLAEEEDGGGGRPSIIKAVSSPLGMLKQRSSIKTQEQAVAGLVVEDGGGRVIDIKRMNLDFVQCPEGLKECEDTVMWLQWIYVHYVANSGDHCLNLPSRMRREYTKEYTRILKEHREGSLEEDEERLIEFFDRAQAEIWKLMVKDSLMQFRRTDVYAQMFWDH